jgi:hypothetical protein
MRTRTRENGKPTSTYVKPSAFFAEGSEFRQFGQDMFRVLSYRSNLSAR